MREREDEGADRHQETAESNEARPVHPVSEITHEHDQHRVTHLVQWGDGSWWVAAETEAALDGGDGAFEVGAVEELRELQQSMAQDEQLKTHKNTRKHMRTETNTGRWIQSTNEQ